MNRAQRRQHQREQHIYFSHQENEQGGDPIQISPDEYITPEALKLCYSWENMIMQIAQECNISRHEAEKSITELQKKGLIDLEVTKSGEMSVILT